jgi:hypothetical protein
LSPGRALPSGEHSTSAEVAAPAHPNGISQPKNSGPRFMWKGLRLYGALPIYANVRGVRMSGSAKLFPVTPIPIRLFPETPPGAACTFPDGQRARSDAAARSAAVWCTPPGSASSNVLNYNVYRSGSSVGPYNFIASVSTATNYGDYNVQSGQSYYYVTTAVDNTGQESLSLLSG